MKIEDLDSQELWSVYSRVIKRLKELGDIRSKNITGDRGERLAIDFYNKTSGSAKLQAAPPGTQNIDAVSNKGERYTIKTIMLPNRTTGVFYGLGTPEKPIKEKKFEYLIIVVLNEFYELERIIELNWNLFFANKRWHSRMGAFNINITKDLLIKSKILCDKDELE